MTVGSAGIRSGLPAVFSPRRSPRDVEERALEFPSDQVELSRHQRPVVLLHGTIVEKEGIEAYRDFALRSGHPVNHRTYSTITNGAPIEESTEIASREVNLSRAEVAKLNLKTLDASDPKALDEFFQLDGELYGGRDPDVDRIRGSLPGLLNRVGDLVAQPQSRIESSLSGQLQALEADLAAELAERGTDPDRVEKLASTLVDTLAPKAILVGHSAGGMVAYNMLVNPEPVLGEDDPFAYDGGHGVGEALLLSSPVGKGLPTPAPPGILGLPYYNYESKVLRPLEKLPPVQAARLNPMTEFMYNASKAWLSATMELGTQVSLSLTSPLVHLARPGYGQVEEGSSFFDDHVKDKMIPDGVSVIAMTSPLDQLSQQERSRVETGQPNAHNFSADLGVSAEDIQRERPTWSHVIMTEKPDAFQDQFAEHLSRDGKALSQILDLRNDEGTRFEALSLLSQEVAKDPSLLDKRETRQALERVANERMPFRDSPSYLAHQLLRGSIPAPR